MIGVVLSGGRHTRFPYPKGLIELGGATIIERNIELLRSVAGEVVISANGPEDYFRFGVPVIGDVVEPGGPLAGIYSVLRCTGADWVLAVACDMPFIDREFISYIIEYKGGDAAVAVFGGRTQPLPGLYASTALRAMEGMIESGTRSLVGLLDRINSSFVAEDEVRKIDPEGRSFVNINTLEDLEKALKKA